MSDLRDTITNCLYTHIETAYGAEWTGETDATDAILAAVAEALTSEAAIHAAWDAYMTTPDQDTDVLGDVRIMLTAALRAAGVKGEAPRDMSGYTAEDYALGRDDQP